jgi:hypothetical protein
MEEKMNRKLFFSILALGVLLAPVFAEGANSAGSNHRRIEALPPYRQIAVTRVDQKADFGDTLLYGEPGQPLLPYFGATFLVPPDTDLDRVTVRWEGRAETVLRIARVWRVCAVT